MTYQDIVNIIRNAANYVNPNGFFIHGRKTDGSLNYNEDTPQILLLEPQPNTANNNSSFIETITFPIIFVTQDSPESTELRREDLKQEMYLLSRKLLAKIDEEPLLQNVQFTGGQPEIRQLSATLTGFSYSIQITYPLSECSLDFDLPPSIKLFATQTTVASGTTVQIGWIADNVNSVNITPFGVLQGQFGFVNTVVNATNTFNGSATNDNGTATDSITITVGNGCDDATAVLKDTANNTISTTNIPSGDTEDIVAPDGTVTAVNSNNSFSQSQAVTSGGTANLNLPDITVTDSDGSTFQQPSVTDVVCSPAPVLAVDFSANDTTPDTNQTITFTDLTVGATQWLWDFGDGTTSTLQNPTKAYKYAGNYTVTLCATNGTVSGKEVKTNYIVVTLQTIVQTNLQAHYKALVGASPPNATLVSGAVSQWNDIKSGYNLVQGTPTNRPTYTELGYTAPDGNVYATLDLDGTNDLMTNSDAGFVRNDGSTVYIALRNNAVIASVRNLLASDTATHALATEGNTLSIRVNALTSGMAYPLNNFYLLRVTFSASIGEIKINDLLGRVLNTATTAGTGFRLGGTVNPSPISVLEVAEYSAKPTAGQDTDIINYFESKFGICG